MNNCEYEKDGHCTLNECMYGDYLFIDDSAFETGKYCFCDNVEKNKRNQSSIIKKQEDALKFVSALRKLKEQK